MQDEVGNMGTTFNYNRATLISIFTLPTFTNVTSTQKNMTLLGNKYVISIWLK
jgi:hypothetical protein